MLIYAASMQARPGRSRDVAEHVTRLRHITADATGEKVWAWRSVGAGPFGGFGLSMRFDGTADLIKMQQTIGEDEKFQAAAQDLAPDLLAPAQITVNQVIGATQEGEPKAFATITTATMTSHLTRALTWAQGTLESVTRHTGLTGVLCQPTSGRVFELSWIFAADSPEEMDTASEKLAVNEEYLHRLDETDGLFIEGSVNRFLLAQL